MSHTECHTADQAFARECWMLILDFGHPRAMVSRFWNPPSYGMVSIDHRSNRSNRSVVKSWIWLEAIFLICCYVQFSRSRYHIFCHTCRINYAEPFFIKACHSIIYFEEIHIKVKFFFELYISWGATLLTSGKSKRGWRAQLIMWLWDDPYLDYISYWSHFFRSNISSNSYISRTEKMIR